MFNFIWRRFLRSQARKTPIKRRPLQTALRVEMLEDRVTPANFTATISGSTLTLNATGNGAAIDIVNASTFQEFTLSDTSLNNTINGGSSYTTTTPITAMVINLGTGNNSLTFDNSNGAITLTGPASINSAHQYVQAVGTDLTITGTGGNKTITATDLNLLHEAAGLTMTLSGNGTETSTFTDSNISGSATISHTGTGDTAFTIATSNSNATALNSWGSISITNGTGSDINNISDTNFSGNVSITNGAGSNAATENVEQFGGSETLFSDINYSNLLTIGGNLTISTTTGQSDTEVNDYSVHGALSITGGAGINGQSIPNFIGVANNETNAPGSPSSGTAISGVPTFGSISITSGSIAAEGLTVYVGTNNTGSPPDNPILVATTLSISATGSGAAAFTLDGLTVDGAATLTTAATTSGDSIDIFGDGVTTTYGSLTINSSATAGSTSSSPGADIDLQTESGTLKILGALNVNFGAGDDALALGSAYVPGSGSGASATAAVAAGVVSTGGVFGVTGTGGSKTVTVVSGVFASMSWALKGTDSITGTKAETASFTDTNVTGAAIINNTVVGTTTFTIATSVNNTTLLNTWGSLSITNGTGADTNNITDTDFTGSVTINNGAGATGNGGVGGGSNTYLGDDTNTTGPNGGPFNTDLLTIAGNLTITTTTGNSITEIQDYNIHGNVTLGAGAGIVNQNSIVGLEDSQTVMPAPSGASTTTGTTAGIPIIGGSVTITGSPILNSNLTVVVGTGTNSSGSSITGDFPLIIGNGVNATITGAGTVGVTLNDLTVTGTSNISLASTTIDDSVTVQEGNSVPTSYGALTISALGAGANGTNTVNLESSTGTLNVNGALTVGLGADTDNLNIGSANSNVNVTGTFTLTAALGNTSDIVTIKALEDTFGALNWTLSGKGIEATTFTDTNVTGAATINASSLTGAAGTTGASANPTTSFTINTSAANTAALNTWGSLTITDGTGSDMNSIEDTDFTGNVSIANGAGATGYAGPDSGSQTILSDGLNKNLLTIHGTLSITTTTGQSDTEVYDYNVHGSVTLAAGTGVANQVDPNVVGLEDNQTVSGSGVPVIGGAVTITAGTITDASLTNGGLTINLGTDGTHNYPLVIGGNLSITTSGTGAANLDLNDLRVATGTTTITLGSGNKNDLVQVQGSTTFASIFDIFTINSTAVGSTFSLQDAAGTLEFTGTVTDTLGSTGVTLNLGADSSNTSGVTGAVVDLFGLSTFKASGNGNTLFEGTQNTNLFYINTPTITDI